MRTRTMKAFTFKRYGKTLSWDLMTEIILRLVLTKFWLRFTLLV